MIKYCLLFTLILANSTLHSQQLLSPNNGKAIGDNFASSRPTLSFNGLTGLNNNGTYSIQSFIVEHILVQNVNSYSRILAISQLSRQPRTDLYNLPDSAINRVALNNVKILEAKAFLSLITVILQKNYGNLNNGQKSILIQLEIDRGMAGLEDDHLFYRNSLKEFFFSRGVSPAVTGSGYIDIPDLTLEIFNPYWFVQRHPAGNLFKMSTSLEILARAWDLYLALEKNNNKISMAVFT